MHQLGRKSQYLLIATAAIIASVGVAAAQTSPAPTPSSGPGWGHHGEHRPGPQDWQAEHAKMEQRRLAELHAKLNLKPGQEPAWQAFVTGLHAAHPGEKPPEKPDWDEMKMQTTPERLDHMLARIDDMRAHLAQMDQTVKTFYAGLSKDQQTIFDDNFRPMGGRHGGPGGWGRHGMGHGRMEHGPMDHGPMDRRQMGPAEGPGMTGGPPPQM